MESIAPSSHESLVFSSSEADSSPNSSAEPQVEFTQGEAITELEEKIPELESVCEDIRRCYGAVLENLYVSRKRLTVLKDSNVSNEEVRAAIMEFLYAVNEAKNNAEAAAFSARQTEVATNEMVKGARQMTKI